MKEMCIKTDALAFTKYLQLSPDVISELADYLPDDCWVKRYVDDSDPSTCYLLYLVLDEDGAIESAGCLSETTQQFGGGGYLFMIPGMEMSGYKSYDEEIFLPEKVKEDAKEKESYTLIKGVGYLPELGEKIQFIDEEQTVLTDDFQEMLLDINDWIVGYGMDDNQNLCTEYGRQLYGLYDELLELRRTERFRS